MDDLKAFAISEEARRRGATMTYFDGYRIKDLMIEKRVEKAWIYLSGDRENTETEIRLKEDKLEVYSIGTEGSIWAKPMLDIDGEEFEVGTKDSKKMTIEFKRRFEEEDEEDE